MTASVLTNALLLFDGFDLTGQSNAVAIDYGVEAKDDTTLNKDTRSNCGGLKTAGFSAEGFVDASLDADLYDEMGVSGSLISVAPDPAAGAIAYSLEAVLGEYQPLSAEVGELLEFSLNASAQGALKRGQVLLHGTSISTSGSGSGVNAGAAVTQLTAVLHVFSAGGMLPTLDVIVESDSDNTFLTPTTRASFQQAAGRNAERVVVAGPVTDTWWRASYTVGGTDPVFGAALILMLE